MRNITFTGYFSVYFGDVFCFTTERGGTIIAAHGVTVVWKAVWSMQFAGVHLPFVTAS